MTCNTERIFAENSSDHNHVSRIFYSFGLIDKCFAVKGSDAASVIEYFRCEYYFFA